MRILKYLRAWLDGIFFDEEGFVLLALLLGVFLVVFFLGSALAPLLSALILSFLLQGVVALLARLPISRNLAVHITFVLFLGASVVFLLFFIPVIIRQISSFINALPGFAEQVRSMMDRLPALYPAIISEDQVQTWVEFTFSQLQEGGQWALTTSVDLVSNLVTLTIYLVLTFMLTYFLLRDSTSLLHFVQSLLPQKRALIMRVGSTMNAQISNYIRGKAVEIVVVGGITYICFLFFGLNYALILACLVGFSVLVPFIGAAVVTIPIAFVALLQWGWSAETAWLLTAYGIIQLLDGNLLVPLLFSGMVNLHPATIIISILVFGGIWGFWGVFFAIPLATLVKAVYASWPAEEILKKDIQAT